MKSEKLKQMQLGVWIVLLIALFWGFKELILHHAPDVFRAKEEDMSFAWFVPVYSLYVLWRERERTRAALSAGRPSLWGFVLALPCLALGFFGARGLQVRFEIVGLVGLLIAIPWIVYGGLAAKRFVFPALFLCFCIPLATFLDVITVHLRLLATSVAYALMHGFGADIVRKGTMLAAGDGSFAIDVADPCGGLRSIFALMAITAGYAYFVQKTWVRRGLLFLCSIPLAIFGNVMRIFSICFVAHVASSEFATGYYHDFSWIPVYAVPLLCIPLLSELIARVGRKKGAEKGSAAPEAAVEDARPPADKPRRAFFDCFVLALALLVLVPVSLWQAVTPRPRLEEAPGIVPPVLAGYAVSALPVSEAELTVLPKDTQFVKRLYVSEKGENFAVSWVIGGASKSSIHRPELCLPSQGFQMMSPHTITVDGRSWREIFLETQGTLARRFSYTFYNQAGFQTSSHVSRIWRDIWDRSILNRIDRWVMITVYGDCKDETRWRAFLSRLMR
ncbi:MAG TPA: hypothetical protein DD637_01615 [Verrucomicrobia bacterium]|nr:hypothetical protein [Verrucomicrobiota bacterium]HCG19411.1 hypothetical protein [Verrucomicrobiota bacterium]